MIDKSRRTPCFNCKSRESKQYPVFCNDCWRMALIMAAFGGSSSEGVHRLIGMLFP